MSVELRFREGCTRFQRAFHQPLARSVLKAGIGFTVPSAAGDPVIAHTFKLVTKLLLFYRLRFMVSHAIIDANPPFMV